ncbi:MAG: hypothetical protein H0A75_03050 [Candidatus Methanofishera endochildressiae]|uniref:Uncharacterized protein n=1 Tax=Candidatus Methanofishera endochildressiae TaxID=2738884 RepID=A0A7Z0SDG7_9GAMM|nr:hypothetical protein [Candidatus Methanofishera endochildressiae]
MKIFFHRSVLLLLRLKSVAPWCMRVTNRGEKGRLFHGFTVQVRQQSEIAALDFGHCDAVIGIKLAVVKKKLLDCEPGNDSLIFRQAIFFPLFPTEWFSANIDS